MLQATLPGRWPLISSQTQRMALTATILTYYVIASFISGMGFFRHFFSNFITSTVVPKGVYFRMTTTVFLYDLL